MLPDVRASSSSAGADGPVLPQCDVHTGESSSIAVIGMACRVPQATDPVALWHLLCAGREGLTCFSDAVLQAAGVPRRIRAATDYVPVNGFLSGIESFDAAFFNMSPRE